MLGLKIYRNKMKRIGMTFLESAFGTILLKDTDHNWQKQKSSFPFRQLFSPYWLIWSAPKIVFQWKGSFQNSPPLSPEQVTIHSLLQCHNKKASISFQIHLLNLLHQIWPPDFETIHKTCQQKIALTTHRQIKDMKNWEH